MVALRIPPLFLSLSPLCRWGRDALSSNADNFQGRIRKGILKIAGNSGREAGGALSFNDDDGNKRSRSAWNGNNSMRTTDGRAGDGRADDGRAGGRTSSNCDGRQALLLKLREINGPLRS